MGVAYSGGHVEYAILRADTIAHLQTDLDALLLRCGWVHSAITGGWEYTAVSPQGFNAKLRVFNDGSTEPFTSWPLLKFQMRNYAGTVSGQQHLLATTSIAYSTHGYEAIAGPCQLFLALPGYATAGLPNDGVDPQSVRYAFACGIPYVASPVDACATSSGAATTTDIWWANSKGATTSDHDHFRSGRFCSGFFDAYRNGAVWSVSTSVVSIYDGPLQLVPLTETEDVDFWFNGKPQILRYGTNDPMLLNPFLAWAGAIRGQLWDSFLTSAPGVLDEVTTTTETDTAGGTRLCTWRAWNYKLPLGGAGGGGTWFATLHLLQTGHTRGVQNLAY